MRFADAARVGVTVVLGIALLAGIWLATRGMFPLVTPSRTLRVAFDNVQGIQPRAPVMLRGVKVGEVQEIDLSGTRQAVLTLKIDRDDLPPRARFRIASSLFGFSSPTVEIVPAPDGQPIPRGNEVATTLQGEGAGTGPAEMMPKAEQLVDNVNRLALQMSGLTANLNRIAGNPRLQQNFLGIGENLATGTRNLATGSRNLALFSENGPQMGRNLLQGSQQVNQLLAALQLTGARFQGTLTKMDQLMTEFQGTAGVMRSTTEEFHGTGKELHAAAAENRERLAALMTGLQGSLTTLNATLEQTQSLVADPELRGNLKATSDNVRLATENLKKLTGDVQGLTGDPTVQSDLKTALSTLRETTQEALTAFQQVNRLLGTPKDTISRFKESASDTQLSVIGMADARNGRGKVMADVTVPWGDEAFWRLGYYDRGKKTGLNAQYGHLLGWGDWQAKNVWWRLGMHASEPGAGIDWGKNPARAKLSADFYNLQTGRLDLLGSLRLNSYFDAMLGVDNVFRAPAPMIGIRFQYPP